MNTASNLDHYMKHITSRLAGASPRQSALRPFAMPPNGPTAVCNSAIRAAVCCAVRRFVGVLAVFLACTAVRAANVTVTSLLDPTELGQSYATRCVAHGAGQRHHCF